MFWRASRVRGGDWWDQAGFGGIRGVSRVRGVGWGGWLGLGDFGGIRGAISICGVTGGVSFPSPRTRR